jgi:radical SAM superfamily enzyme YgiQ (UPF0313 family)
MADIALVAINAAFTHASFGARYLLANLQELRAHAMLFEFTIKERTTDLVEAVLVSKPRVVGLGVYVWNVREAQAFCATLKRVAPEVTIVLGGPEVSYELSGQPFESLADIIVQGEGDVAFREVCQQVLAGKPPPRVIRPALPDLSQLALPYSLYSDADLKNRTLYVELSRGCPFKCEFCLSSLDEKVRPFETDRILAELDLLISRGARQFKFVDRTFNLSLATCEQVLRFFLERQHLELFAHFELIPDRLPAQLQGLIAQFAPGRLQFELGIQTFDPGTSQRISRPLNEARIEANLRWLGQTGVHVHADLIVGLPGEDEESFARGFDRLVKLSPSEIQVGVLKRLKGTPITRHDRPYGLVWSDSPPFEILQTAQIPFSTMQRLKRFARVWDLFANRGNFQRSLPKLWSDSTSPYSALRDLTEWIDGHADLGGIALLRQVELLWSYWVEVLQRPASELGPLLAADYLSAPGRFAPPFLSPFAPAANQQRTGSSLPARQAAHVRARG